MDVGGMFGISFIKDEVRAIKPSLPINAYKYRNNFTLQKYNQNYINLQIVTIKGGGRSDMCGDHCITYHPD